jgi:hypothetical protein
MQVGGFDLIYKETPVALPDTCQYKTHLGTLNNRVDLHHQDAQLRSLAKLTASKLNSHSRSSNTPQPTPPAPQAPASLTKSLVVQTSLKPHPETAPSNGRRSPVKLTRAQPNQQSSSLFPEIKKVAVLVRK